ncbi:hypothetical protein OESDEN_11608 [Oesophagostomum dentatum]|uniref:Secreted protein n=1 Tax=Oesophagostomum dentatum TaxID=61180 RepID=A0A0B1SXG5_OESDE|nr:hypothetical protein OESDEN_11608 [Oesophagostomum dentatum]
MISLLFLLFCVLGIASTEDKGEQDEGLARCSGEAQGLTPKERTIITQLVRRKSEKSLVVCYSSSSVTHITYAPVDRHSLLQLYNNLENYALAYLKKEISDDYLTNSGLQAADYE